MVVEGALDRLWCVMGGVVMNDGVVWEVVLHDGVLCRICYG